MLIDQLRASIEPANADTVVHVAAGTYTLDPGTRLVLPPGMDLVGEERTNGRESKIVVRPERSKLFSACCGASSMSWLS